jgi:hypothetical protein
MEDFSYSSDISPLKGEYFSGSSLSDRERSMLSSKYKTATDAALDSQLKSQKEMLQTQSQALDYERTKFALESAKKEARQQVEFEKLYPEISKRIIGIQSDTSLDPLTRISKLEATRAEYGEQVVKNPQLNTIFNASISGVSAFEDQKNKRDSMAMQLVNLGAKDVIKTMYPDVTTGMGKTLYDAASAVDVQRKEEAKLKTDIAKQQLDVDQAKAARKLDLDILKGHESALRSFAPKGTSDDDFIAALQTGVAPTATKDKDGKPLAVPEAPTFSPLQVMEMKEIMMDLNPSLQQDPAKLDSVPPEELYKYAFRAISRQRRGYLQSRSQPSTKNLFEE